MLDLDIAVSTGSMESPTSESPTSVWADLHGRGNLHGRGAGATIKKFALDTVTPSPSSLEPLTEETEPAGLWTSESRLPRRPAPLATGHQMRCLKTLFRMYATWVFMPEHSRDGLLVSSRTVASLSRDGWNRFCREILRGGVIGLPIIPCARMISLYPEHAARQPYVTPRLEFVGRQAGGGVPPREVQPIFGWGAFVGLLEDVADQWYASLGSAHLPGKRTPWVSLAAARGVASSLSSMCDEVACSSFHNPIADKMLTARQLFPAAGGATESRRCLLPQHVALWDLLISPGV